MTYPSLPSFLRSSTVLFALGSVTSCAALEPDIGSPALERIVLEVHYEPAAEPYTGAGPGGNDTWNLFATNSAALFQGTEVTVEHPTTLSEMSVLDDLPDADFDVARLLEIDAASRQTASDGSTKVFRAYWVDGYFADEDGRRDGVIGVSIGNTGVIAMFKPVIETLGALEGVRRFSEQTTLLHEFGHAVGLVNNGLTLQTDHHDADNGAHCVDDTCVMYWANEGAGDLVEFVSAYALSGDAVVFDDDCLADVRAAFLDE